MNKGIENGTHLFFGCSLNNSKKQYSLEDAINFYNHSIAFRLFSLLSGSYRENWDGKAARGEISRTYVSYSVGPNKREREKKFTAARPMWCANCGKAFCQRLSRSGGEVLSWVCTVENRGSCLHLNLRTSVSPLYFITFVFEKDSHLHLVLCLVFRLTFPTSSGSREMKK